MVGKLDNMILKPNKLILLILSLIFALSVNAAGQQYKIESSVHPESLTVGDKFQYVNRIENPGNVRIEPMPLGEELGDASVLSKVFKLGGQTSDTVAYACTLAVYQPGEVEIPTFTFLATDTSGQSTEFSGEATKLEIKSVLPPDTSGLEIADIKEPYRLRGPIWPYLLIPLAVAIIVLGLVLLRKRLRGKAVVPELPPRPPWEIAFEELDNLKEKRHLEYGRMKQYYFELSLIVRAYLEGRFGFPAVESTTYEIESQASLKAIDKKLYNGLFESFFRADLAKFARLEPSRSEAEADLSFAFDFVRKTIPVVEHPAVEKPKEEGVLKEDVSV